jgi:hypothetical protein
MKSLSLFTVDFEERTKKKYIAAVLEIKIKFTGVNQIQEFIFIYMYF